MYKKLLCCKFCNESFENKNSSERANHTRWCKLNPKSEDYRLNRSGIIAMNSSESVSKRTESLKKAHKEGKYAGASSKAKATRTQRGNNLHTEESKKKISEAARKSTHRRLVRSTRKYTTKEGDCVLLDSSWEEALAKRLDELDIRWLRPKEPIVYVLDGVQKNYFPDFYLLDYDLFLDPKNPYALKVQKRKIDIILEKIKNLKILSSIEECKNFKP